MNTFLVILACLSPLVFLIRPRFGIIWVYVCRVALAFILFWGFLGIAALRARGILDTQALYYGENYDILSAVIHRGWVLAGLYLTPFVLAQYIIGWINHRKMKCRSAIEPGTYFRKLIQQKQYR